MDAVVGECIIVYHCPPMTILIDFYCSIEICAYLKLNLMKTEKVFQIGSCLFVAKNFSKSDFLFLNILF